MVFYHAWSLWLTDLIRVQGSAMLSRASVLCSSVWLNNVSFSLSLHQLSPQYMCRTCVLPLPLTVPERPLPLTVPGRSIGCFLPPFGSLKPLPWLHLLLPPCLQGGERHLLHTGSSFPTDSSHSQPAPCHLYSNFRENKFKCSFPSFYRCFKYFTGYMVVTYFLCFSKNAEVGECSPFTLENPDLV